MHASRTRRALHRISIAVMGLAMAAAATAAGRATLKAGAFDPPAAVPEIALVSSHGGTLSLARYRGKVVLLEFGFTNCPQVCPMTLATLAQARRQLGAEASKVQVVFVTVDPQRDDAARMRAYLKGFDPTFVGGTGTPAQLAAVRARYGATAQRKAVGDSYTVGHSSSVYLIDTKGRLRGMMPYGRPAADYVHDVRALLAE
jgi:protein SCO1/2